jgi:TPR repeat protein
MFPYPSISRLTLALTLLLALTALAPAAHADAIADYQNCLSATKKTAPEAQYCTGIIAYKNKDYPSALTALAAATEGGNGSAAGLLGYMYERGSGVAPNPTKAFYYYQQAAKLGSADGMHELARAYDHGIGTPKNPAEAEHWYKLAEAGGTEKGQQNANARNEPDQADFNAGVAPYRAKNYAQAFQLFLRAANAGNSKAQLQVGSQYEQGEGVPQNDVEAVRWYARSAANGNAIAQKNLGQMYENGQGIAENWPLAAEWYQKSAEQANSNGEFALGRAYEFGIGVEQDRALAIKWFQRSGAQGNTQGEYFAKWLAQPTNFIGFRNKEEHDFVMDRIRYAGDFLGGDPTGRLFRSSKERNAFIIAFKQSATFHESQTQWGVRHNDYTSCIGAGGGSGCHNPGPPPALPQ